MSITIEEAKKYLKKFGIDVDLDYKICKEALEYFTHKDDLEGLVTYMSQIQNCGGYALEIPVCIWPPIENYTFEEMVLRIMELYPFVRLLSNSQLKENEYIVMYRAQGDGHHFIKLNDKGEAMEKYSAELPQKFDGWVKKYKSAPEAVLAVIKPDYRDDKIKKLPQCNNNIVLDRDYYEYTKQNGYTDIMFRDAKKPATFKRTLIEAYNNKSSTFIYNNKEFYLVTDEDDKELIYICDKSDIFGTVCTDGETFIIELHDKKKNLVFGFEAIPPINIVNEKEPKQQEDVLGL